MPDGLEDNSNWNAILQWSLRFQDTPNPDRQLTPFDEERRQFLSDALRSAVVADPAREMHTHVALLKNTDSSEEECLYALEALAFHAEDIDQANDLYLIGGLQVCCAYLKHTNTELQNAACEVIASAVQNNEKVAMFVTDSDVLNILLKLVEGEKEVRVKSLYAVSCLVRGNNDALEKFNELEGYNVIVRALQSDITKLQTKALFMVSSICASYPKQSELYCTMGITEQLFVVLGSGDVSGPSTLHALSLLLSISRDCPDAVFPKDARDVLLELRTRLDTVVQAEEVNICETLLQRWPDPRRDSVER